MNRQSLHRTLLLAVLLLAFGLRCHQLEVQSFWNDEGNSARLSERPIVAIVEGTASDIHPPLYYLLLRGWRELAGDTEFGLRSLSAFAGTLLVAATIALARAGRGRAGLAAAAAGLLTAVSPALVYYSQEARMYALLALEAALATWILQLALARSNSGSPRRLWAAYTLVAAAGLYTHYFFPAVLAGHALYLALRAPALRAAIRAAGGWLLAMLAAGLLYLPWLPIFLRQAGGRAGEAANGRFLLDAWRWLVVGDTLPAAQAAAPLLAAALLALLGLAYGRGRALLPALMLAAPVAFMGVSGATQSQFFKFLGVAIPFLALLISCPRLGQARLAAGRPAAVALRLLAAAAALVLLSGSGHSLHNLYSNPAYARADYRGMAARIAAAAHPNAGVILNAPNQWEVFTYYFPDVARVYPLPRGQPDAAVLEPELAAIAARHDRLYAIFWGEAQRDPERLVERWLDAHAFKATEEWVQDVRFVTYAVPRAATEMAAAVSLPFGDHITLSGYTLAVDTLQPADIIQLTLFWQTDAPLDQRYKVFLHLVDNNGELVAQRDSEPGGGLNLTSIWQPGARVVDNHGILIPATTPPGSYTLRLGLYDIADPTARLPIQTPEGAVDAYPLGQITIRP